jgi:hypothetical protein
MTEPGFIAAMLFVFVVGLIGFISSHDFNKKQKKDDTDN